MSGIAGIIGWGEEGLPPQSFQRMVAAMAYWGPDGCQRQQSHNAAFAHFHAATTPEAVYERQPRILENGQWLVAAARLDNRGELCDILQIDHSVRATLADGDLIERAYLRWGQGCVDQLVGDWSFAIYNPETQQLFLARDQCGNTGLYYHANDRYFAFASGRKALLALDSALHTFDDLYIAQVLLSWPVYHGARTVHTKINRLPPAHTLVASAQSLQSRLYWRMEEFTTLPLRSLDEAVEGFLEVFDRAVADRVRANGQIGTTLSGGLDSGSVTATAAALLSKVGVPLFAYTSVPLTPEGVPTAQFGFGDEWDFASATAQFARITEHRPIRAAEVTPLLGVEDSLWVHDEPQHAGGNSFWITSLLHTAASDGVKVLLTGQGGNASISWTGNFALRKSETGGLYHRLKSSLLRSAPESIAAQLRIWKARRKDNWYGHTSVNPDLVRRTDVFEQSVNDPNHPIRAWNTPGLRERLAVLDPGRSIVGALWHENSAASGVEVRDPTFDMRLIRYCLAVPERLYYDAKSTTDRMLIRQAMRGRLPEVVRLNRKRGFQSADVAHRLRIDAPAINQTLEELQHGPAADYLNMPKMWQVWAEIQERDDMKSYRDSIVILLRGIMAGLFVQQPTYPRPRPTLPTPETLTPQKRDIVI
jgi:asparagine synthase (glutamine-hydrolysing)